jgi:hypothetical protein
MFAIIAKDPVSLARAIKIDVGSEEQALERCLELNQESFNLFIDFLINLDTGDILRVYRDGSGPFKTHPSAYDYLGDQTGKAYFENDKED